MLKKGKKRKTIKDESHAEVNNYKKNEISIWEWKSFYKKTILTYGKDVTMSSRTQTTEFLLGWKHVRQAVGWALYTLVNPVITAKI